MCWLRGKRDKKRPAKKKSRGESACEEYYFATMILTSHNQPSQKNIMRGDREHLYATASHESLRKSEQ